MTNIDNLLIPRIESRAVTYSEEVELPSAINVAISNRNAVTIEKDKVVIEGKGEEEIRMGKMYVEQLSVFFSGKLPVCSFTFYSPAFNYRGFHLDCVRHFMHKEELKRIIHIMALTGFNYFHFHLTDDQGWRFPVPGYEKLEEISSKREKIDNDDEKHVHKGFYSKEDLIEIENYCRELGVTAIPEVEMPGHAEALLAAYPEFGCTGKTIPVQNNWGIFENVMNPASPELWTFIDATIKELASIFHGPFIHIGGDECPHVQWETHDGCLEIMKENGLKDTNELQGWFTSKASAIVKKYGKRAIGWDEVVDAPSIDKSVVVMSWRGLEGARIAAKRGHNIILCPQYAGCYLDRYQSKNPWELGNLSDAFPRSTFDLDVSMKELPEDQRKLILGGQCCLWCEKIHTGREAEYMLFPRSFIMAENLWLGDKKDWEELKKRRNAMAKLCWNLDIVCSPTAWD